MKFHFFITGIVLSSLGLSFIILYLNLLTLGYSFLEYVKFISSKVECLILILGIIFIVLSMKRRKIK